MRIAIDARAVSHPQPGGFKTYVTSLLQALLSIDNDCQYVVILDRPISPGVLPETERVEQIIVNNSLGILNMPLREQWQLSRRLSQVNHDLFHAPCSSGPMRRVSPMVVTIHDAIDLNGLDTYRTGPLFKRTKRSMMSSYNRRVETTAAQVAELVVTPSQHAKNDLTNALPISAEKIRVIPNAPSPRFQVLDSARIEAFRQRRGLPQTFVLSLVSAAPRKNAAGLIHAYARLPEDIRNRFPLVIVWTHTLILPEISSLIDQHELNHCVQFLQEVTDDDLVLLYNAAETFVFPSLYEGFGLPILEAMACGTPVVASNLTSIPEVAGDAAAMCNPNDPQAFAETLARVLESPEEQRRLREAGLRRAQQFSWEKTAQSTLDVYREAYQYYRRRLRPRDE